LRTRRSSRRRRPAAAHADERGRRPHAVQPARCISSASARQGRVARRRSGVKRGRVTVLGGGVVGANATKIAVGLGANVTVLERESKTLAYLDDIYAGRISTSTPIRSASSAPCSRGPRGRRGADRRRARAAADHRADGQGDGARLGDRRRVDRPGRLRRDRAADHPRQSDVLVHDVIHYGVANMPRRCRGHRPTR